MAREKMVTRTVSLTVVTAMCLNVTSAQVETVTYELSGTYTDNNSVLKALQKQYDTDTFKVVTVITTSEKETLYGMSEVEFIKLAKVLPPRGTKSDIEE